MILRLLLPFVLALSLAGCGVKSDLEKPNGEPSQKGETDHSKPLSPVGQ